MISMGFKLYSGGHYYIYIYIYIYIHIYIMITGKILIYKNNNRGYLDVTPTNAVYPQQQENGARCTCRC